VDESLNGVPFNARLASQIGGASTITSDSNVDSFQFDVKPLHSVRNITYFHLLSTSTVTVCCPRLQLII
jgi:hypothetical protein